MLIEDNSPESLLIQCSKYCVRYPKTFCDIDTDGKIQKLKQDVSLPQDLAERLLNSYNKYTGLPVNDFLISILSDTQNARLERVHIPFSEISDYGFELLFCHKIVDLDISGAFHLTANIYNIISEKGKFLRKLNCSMLQSTFVNLLPFYLLLKFKERGYVFQAQNLKWFKITDLDFDDISSKITICVDCDMLLNPLVNLTHLDLSNCGGIHKMNFLKSMSFLSSLVLFNVKIDHLLQELCDVKTLKCLDISQDGEKYFEYVRPQEFLHSICASLPLFTMQNSGMFSAEDVAMTDIPGLLSKVKNPLQFLGLYDTNPDVSTRRFPAKRVSGTGSEVQVLTALKLYMDRLTMTKKVLNQVFLIFRHQEFEDQSAALDLIIEAMDKYLYDRQVQISGSASLFYIIKNLELSKVGNKLKQTVIRTLLKAVDRHKSSATMLRNGCLTFCRFESPKDFLFEYRMVCKILLHIIKNHRNDEFVMRMAMFLLNSLVCDVGYEWKFIAGDLRTIQVMLALINFRLLENICDDSMELAWSVMWNITDNSDVDYEPMESDNETIDSYESDDVDLSEHEDDGVMLSDSWKRISDIFSDCRPNSLPELVRNFSGVNPALNCNANNSVLDCFKKFITNDVIVLVVLSCDRIARSAGATPLVLKGLTFFLSVTLDEMPGTCWEFVDTEGMESFLRCLQTFPDKTDLLRNMLGLLGNISEVMDLRRKMTVAECLTVFMELLNAEEDGIEVRYNAGGILSHILADGVDAWNSCQVQSPTREDVLQALRFAIVKWDINSHRSINYRSFDPIFRLVRCTSCLEAQNWAVWALANLTTVSSNKYFKFIEDNNGVNLLTEILLSSESFQCTKDLAKIVIKNYQM
ncbi:Protein zer-1 [Nymphon striatum]|nr:Protein zer-1 [Nymphon striatum]